MSDYLVGFISAVSTLAISKGVPWLLRVYETRYIDPKKAHQDLFLEQAQWYDERAEKLSVLRHELTSNPPRDKFKLTYLVSKLDRQDSKWAMKETDIETLCSRAADEAAACRENSSQCARHAEEITYRTFIFPLG